MILQKLYEEAVKYGIANDVRDSHEIARILQEKNEDYIKLSLKEKESIDKETLTNPFADTRILCGDPQKNIRTVIAGIDVEGAELVTVDRLREKGMAIDLVIAHHPEGSAYAKFYDVMDLQADAFFKAGLPISLSEDLVSERKGQVSRRVHAVNHQRPTDIARLLGVELMCIHTPCDNCAHQFMNKLVYTHKPSTLGALMDLIVEVPEYKDACRHNNAPVIVAGSKSSRINKVWVEFTGGTEGPQEMYQKLSAAGYDTVVAMHQSEEHYKKCKEAHLNVIFASHIASDNLGVNLMLDHLSKQEPLTVLEFSGFRRFSRV